MQQVALRDLHYGFDYHTNSGVIQKFIVVLRLGAFSMDPELTTQSDGSKKIF